MTGRDMTDITLEQVQARITRAPFHQWLGRTVVEVTDDGIEIRATWREEWVVNIERGYTHGGIIAALIDLAADWAMVKQTGRGVPTIDLRVDYHSAAMPGDLTIRGITRRVEATGELSHLAEDPYGGERAGIELTTTIDRTDFGIKWNAELPNGTGFVLADQVTLHVELELTKEA